MDMGLWWIVFEMVKRQATRFEEIMLGSKVFHFFASMNKSGLNEAALRSLSGVQNVEPTIHEVRLYFTQAPGQSDLFESLHDENRLTQK